jgi:outer membrane protein assembly factor BamB
MPGRITVTECPNCGAPIDPHKIDVKDPVCPFCQAALPVEPEPPAFVPRSVAGSMPSTRRRSRWVAPFILVVVLAVVGAIVAVAVNGSSQLFTTNYTLTTPVVAVPASTDFYAVAPTSGGTPNVIRRVDPIHHKVVWSSPSLPVPGSDTPVVVAGASQVFAIFGTTVVALDGASGHQSWEASLSTGPATPCANDCATFVGTHLVVLSKDGTLESFAAATGKQAWSKRLNSTPRWLAPAGSAVVVDDTLGSGPERSALIFDSATGAIRTISPSCPPTDPSDPTTRVQPSDESDFMVSPDGTSLTVLDADIGGCVGRYRLSDGALLWQTQPADDTTIPSTLTGETVVQSGSHILYTNSSADSGANDVFDVDASTGAIRKLLVDKRDDVVLDGVIGSTVVIDATPTYDSTKPTVVGLDVATGHQLWQIATRVVSSNVEQMTVVTNTVPIVVSCDDDIKSCTFEAVDPRTGTISRTSKAAADPALKDEVHPVLSPTTLLVTVGWDHVVGFDPSTAAAVWKWPS